jgi:hypothetical protein
MNVCAALLNMAAEPLAMCYPALEHFQQCAEFLPLRNRGLGALAVAVLPIPLARRAAANAAGVALSRKGAKSRTGGRKLVMLMARPIPRADLKKQESRWACRRSGSSHVSVGLTGLLNPT